MLEGKIIIKVTIIFLILVLIIYKQNYPIRETLSRKYKTRNRNTGGCNK